MTPGVFRALGEAHAYPGVACVSPVFACACPAFACAYRASACVCLACACASRASSYTSPAASYACQVAAYAFLAYPCVCLAPACVCFLAVASSLPSAWVSPARGSAWEPATQNRAIHPAFPGETHDVFRATEADEHAGRSVACRVWEAVASRLCNSQPRTLRSRPEKRNAVLETGEFLMHSRIAGRRPGQKLHEKEARMPNEAAVVPTVRAFAAAMGQQLLRRVGDGGQPLRTRLHATGLRSAAVGGSSRQTQTSGCPTDRSRHARQDDQRHQRSASSVHGALPAGLDAGSDTALLRSWRGADVQQRLAAEDAQTQLARHVGTKGEIHTERQPTRKGLAAGPPSPVWEHAAVERPPTARETTRSRKISTDLHTSYKTQHRSGRLRGCSPPSVRPCFDI